MCYSAKSLKNAALKRALHAGDKAIAEQLREELEALPGLADRAFVNAFDLYDCLGQWRPIGPVAIAMVRGTPPTPPNG
ncbi:MAG: hypothetical protein KBH07_12245 [Flavobacteriales bacterium]|nr:hypothetical protein [Flavobacteriales bacterium]MBP9081194.1 hypothetical protein [Flavobacteriales bacterium]